MSSFSDLFGGFGYVGTAIYQFAFLTIARLPTIARYREIHAEKKEKNWALARMFYTLALRLIPTIGNPFNQLAVIDTYEGDEVGAVERYFRRYIMIFLLSLRVPALTWL